MENQNIFTTTQARNKFLIEPSHNPHLEEIKKGKQIKNILPINLHNEYYEMKNQFPDPKVRFWRSVK
jgi:hypothetical protein